MKNVLKSLVVLTVVGAMVANSTLAAFTAKATVHNSTFATGNAALSYLKALDGEPTGENLTDQLAGPSFDHIYPGWTTDYTAKFTNSGSLNLVSSIAGVKITDTGDSLVTPLELGSQIYVEAFVWHDDVVANGLVDDGELGAAIDHDSSSAVNTAPMSLVDWQTNPFQFGQVNTSDVKGVVFRFSTNDAMDSVLQGQTAVYDFELDGTTTGATQS